MLIPQALALPDLLGLQDGTLRRIIRVLPVVVATSAGTTLVAAFLFLGKRRRDERQPASNAALAAAAATGPRSISTIELVNLIAGPGVEADSVLDPMAEEALLPRWRRPSLMAARKHDPNRHPSENFRMAFSMEVVEASVGYEHATVRYRVVSLLDQPDQFRGNEIGSLDEGDEVIVIERSGQYRKVICPDGRQGWLHRMTLLSAGNGSPENELESHEPAGGLEGVGSGNGAQGNGHNGHDHATNGFRANGHSSDHRPNGSSNGVANGSNGSNGVANGEAHGSSPLGGFAPGSGNGPGLVETGAAFGGSIADFPDMGLERLWALDDEDDAEASLETQDIEPREREDARIDYGKVDGRPIDTPGRAVTGGGVESRQPNRQGAVPPASNGSTDEVDASARIAAYFKDTVD